MARQRNYAATSLATRMAAPLTGVVVGGAAALGMQLWVGASQISIATFIMVSYMAGMLVVVRRASHLDAGLVDHLRTLPINSAGRRVRRMIADRQFWLSLVIGGALLTGAAWYGGLREPRTLTLVGAAWALLDVLLGYDLTLLHPTTRCRRCGYQLMPMLDPADLAQKVRCPECGVVWAKADLCLTPRSTSAAAAPSTAPVAWR